jgi:major membrane immunogen (membrane-anchored lipoprotein)
MLHHFKVIPMTIKRFLVFCLLSGLLVFTVAGCAEEEIINDPATGAILPAEKLVSLMDGQYSASTKYYDSRGYGQELNILIKNNLITQVTITEKNKAGVDRFIIDTSEKSWDDLSVPTLNALYMKLYTELITTQNPDEIQVVSGATQTSQRFKEMSAAIIDQARKGDHETIKIDTFDTYTVISSVDPEGYQGILQASFNGSKLTNLNYDEIRPEDGKSKRKSTDSTVSQNFGALFDTLIRDALTRQNIDSPFPETDISPDKTKYVECLRLLRDLRTPF